MMNRISTVLNASNFFIDIKAFIDFSSRSKTMRTIKRYRFYCPWFSWHHPLDTTIVHLQVKQVGYIIKSPFFFSNIWWYVFYIYILPVEQILRTICPFSRMSCYYRFNMCFCHTNKLRKNRETIHICIRIHLHRNSFFLDYLFFDFLCLIITI